MAIAPLQAVLACLRCEDMSFDTYPDEKAALLAANDCRPAAEVVNDVVDTILRTSLTGPALRMRLDAIVGAYGWRDNMARWVLEKLTNSLQDAHDKLGPAVRDAYHKAWEVARSIEGFVIEHPVMCTIIALGVLCIVAPWMLEALGFAELGPVEGTFASWWQSTYGGLVPKGSLFSFFQRLGMTGHPIFIYRFRMRYLAYRGAHVR